MSYKIILQPTATEMLANISDLRTQRKIGERIEGLKENPDEQGKPLLGELAGYRSLRAAGQRYRIIYRVDRLRVRVVIVALGIRKEGAREDIYSLAKKLLRYRLL